ncbi:hypothetical protein HY385_01115, partial [Candidatus Daviesbacteria bacterium]|nr:hypothetical protein [Candidatus Daviesbacteria bacterium]
VFFCLGMFYFSDLWIWQNKRSQFFLSIIFTALAFLIKPTAIFYLLPLLYVYWQKEKKVWPIPKRYFIWAVSSFLPFILWRLWMMQHPEGIPPSGWLLNGDGIRFKPVFWKWILGERIGKEILSVAGVILLFLGLLIKPKIGQGTLLHFLAASMFLYLLTFATGNVRHDYYQILIIPPLAIFVARGFVLLWQGADNLIPRLFTIPLSCLLLFLTFYLGWGEVRGLYQINNPIILEAGQYANKILPKNAKVIAPYNGDTAFLYQTNRAGWPFVPFAVKDMVRSMGATSYVSVTYDAKTKWLMQRYQVIEANPKFVILDLTKLNPKYLKDNEKEPSS